MIKRFWETRPTEDRAPAASVDLAPLVSLRQAVRHFWPDLRPYRRWLLLTLIVVACGPAVETAKIWLAKLVIDEVIVPGSFDAFPRIALLYLGLTALGAVVFYADDVLSAWISQRFLMSLRTRLIRHLHALSPELLASRRLGDLLTRLTDDIDEIEKLFVSNATDSAAYLLQILFFTGALFLLDWRLALVALAVTPPFWLLAWLVGKRSKAAAREQRRHEGSLSAVAEESLGNAPLVAAYNRQASETERYRQQALGNFAAQMKLARARASFGPLVDLVELGGLLIIVGVGTWQLTEGRGTLGGLLAFLVYLRQLYHPVRGLGKRITDAAAAAAGAERIVELLDLRPDVTERPDGVALNAAWGEVVLDRVTYRYPTANRDALREVSLRLTPGKSLALVGPSGAGKSTVVKLLLRFTDPAAGWITLDGHDLRDLRLDSLRDNIAVLLQETLVFDGTIRENIAFGRAGATDGQIVAAARAADAHDFIVTLPQGYHTRIGQRGRHLSGGQRQRLAIARAMIRDAPILILDEPTTGVDAEAGERILAPLRRLMHGRTTLIISHDLLTVRDADEIVVLEAGRIVERGTHANLLSQNGLYARLYRRHHPDVVPFPGDTPVATRLAGAS